MARPKTVSYPHRANFMPDEVVTVPGDAALPIDADMRFLLTKGSAAAITVAAPGTANIGRKLEILGGSDFAHVVTFTGGTLRDGTTGASTTWTSAAFQGSSVTVRAISATTWNVVANNLGVIA